jgi:hypothetical protein
MGSNGSSYTGTSKWAFADIFRIITIFHIKLFRLKMF